MPRGDQSGPNGFGPRTGEDWEFVADIPILVI